MRLGVKHQNQQPIVRADFSGGLNTSTNVDGIAENQLSVAVNVETDTATGKLKTVAGTEDLLYFPNIFAAMYDEINKALLLVASDRTVWFVNGLITTTVGYLSGILYPVCATWESGILIASGGQLQYFNGVNLITLDSPVATSVYTRAGRVIISDGNSVHYSGVGDETNWAEDTNDDSSAKFVEAGYKDGGNLIGMINLSSDVLLIKDNHRIYRLYGEYPYWQIAEVSRNVSVSGRMSYCAVADSVFILGKTDVQNIQTTSFYGDVKPQNVATLIKSEIQKLPANTLLRYVPPLKQIWAINGKSVLTFNLETAAWYKREFNSPIVDVISIDNEVLVIKQDRVSKLSERTFYDVGLPLQWKWKAQRLVSQHDYLLKRVQVSIIPLDSILYNGQVRVGAVIIGLPIPEHNFKLWHNWSRIYKNHIKICSQGRRRFIYEKSDVIFENLEPIFGNTKPIFSKPTIIVESRNVFRSKFLDISGNGSTGGVIFNSIIMDIAEV